MATALERGRRLNFRASMELAEHGIRVNGFPPTATRPSDPEVLSRMAAPMVGSRSSAITQTHPR
jgi:hypothetical protein